MRRISFTGADLADYPNDGPGTHCKILLPAPGQSEVVLPEPGGDGWSSVEPRPVMRTYTPRLVDTAARTLTVDFAMHEHAGPASAWAAAAAPGDTLVVTGGRGAYRIDAGADWTLLVADATALPAVATMLEDAPTGTRVLLVAEVADEGEHQTFDTRAELTTTWSHPGPAVAAGTTAADQVAQLAFPAGQGRFWVGLEAAAMRQVRRHLLTDRGIDRAALHSRAYWKVGFANHPDHDSGDDD